MKVKNLNNSSFKTKTLIKDTFAEILYEQRNIHKISVTELVRRANINRSTFYSHYDDIWQVAEDIKNETMKAFFANKAINKIDDILPFFDEIYKYIKKSGGKYPEISRKTSPHQFYHQRRKRYCDRSEDRSRRLRRTLCSGRHGGISVHRFDGRHSG